MGKARFWTGVFLLMSPLTVMTIATYARLLEPWASVHGRVTYQGRPLTKGTVIFMSMDRERSSDMLGPLDDDGYYSASPGWWQARPEPTRFRIRIHPDPRQARRESRLIGEGPTIVRGLRGGRRPVRNDGRLASMGVAAEASSPVPASRPATASTAQRSGRMSRPRGPVVSLRSEPVRIDIDLRD